MREEDFPYEDILEKTHPISKHHPQMPLIERAAQFSPFAALRGYEDVISESGRITKKKAGAFRGCKKRIR